MHLIVKFITKLPLIREKDAVLIVCDKLSKIVYFIVITKRILVKRLARLFKDNMWKLHRLPESVISNRRS